MMNFLLVTLDQFRGDCLSSAGHWGARTPNLDRLAADGVHFARHYAQAAPCGPGRASLYTGLYQMTHRVVANGTPLDARFDNLAKSARRAGHTPTLFGYTDQTVDPRQTTGPDDPRLSSYEGVLPGFAVGHHLPMGAPATWLAWLAGLGHAVPSDPIAALASEPQRPAEHSMAAFLTDRFCDWLARREGPWFAHLSHLRPHPPYAAAGRFAALHDPDDGPEPIPAGGDPDPLHAALLALPQTRAPAESRALRTLRAQYLGMVAEADHQLGRVWDALRAAGQWDDTFILVTADHGEQLGDHGLIEKAGWFPQSYHVPLVIRDPRAGAARGARVTAFTESVDVMPTLCEAMGLAVPAQCDGLPLTAFLRGTAPPWWREAAHWEFDWRGALIPFGPHPWPWDRRLERQSLAVRFDGTTGFVAFADGTARAFDVAADPAWQTPVADLARRLAAAQALLAWRAQHLERTLTGLLIDGRPQGRWPDMPEGWGGRSQP